MPDDKIQLKILKESEFDPANSQEKKSGWPKQTFHVSHLREEDFKTDGFRGWALSRDLGMVKATGGMVEAHVNRRAKPFDPDAVSKRHFHDTQFQLVYVLKGWMRAEFEGQEHTMRPGSCWIQPPMIKHTVLGFSDDLELLEIIMPAQYDTVNMDEQSGIKPDPRR